VSRVFRHLAERFSDCTSYEYEVIAAGVGGDAAYTVGFERTSVSVHGQPRSYVLRVTHGYRRERGDWRIVHRHGDVPPPNALPA
jgi:ketosteroid isomerase-like protein